MSDYARPTSLDTALTLLAQEGSVAMGGGTDLAGQIDRRLCAPKLIVDLQAVGLNQVQTDGEGITIGATVTLDSLASSSALAPYAAVAEAAGRAPGVRAKAFSHLLGECGVTVFGTPALAAKFGRNFPAGVGEAPYPPNFPKMPGEPKRVQPSRARKPVEDT